MNKVIENLMRQGWSDFLIGLSENNGFASKKIDGDTYVVFFTIKNNQDSYLVFKKDPI